MTINFSKELEIEGEKITYDFEGNFTEGGFNYPIPFGRGQSFEKEIELTNISLLTPVDKNELKIINDLILAGNLDNSAWDAYNLENNS